MVKFDFYSPVKIHFGSGYRKNVGGILNKYGKKCLIVRTSFKGDERERNFFEMTNSLAKASIEYVIFDQVKSNPTTDIVESGVEIAVEENVDFILGYGGGSSMDAAKAIALLAVNKDLSWAYCLKELSNPFLDHDQIIQALPVVAVTTTSGTGSHVTQASVISDLKLHEKMTFFHSSLFPKVSIIDPEIMITVPKKVTAATGFDALCHAIESYFNPRASVLTKILSLQSIEIIVETLPKLIHDPKNLNYREKLAYADTLSGICLSNAGAEAPHPIGEIINGYFPELSHGETLAFVYPTYFKHVISIIPEKVALLFGVFKDYMPENTQLQRNEKAFYMMENFLKAIHLPATLNINFNQDIIDKIKDKLNFDLPLTEAKYLKQIFEESI